jgi:two-component system, response regulator YesN
MFKVLLVDDEPFVTKALRVLIDWEQLGYGICGEASDGEKAVKLIKEQKPDVVITDIKMPKMDGLQLIKYCSEELNLDSKFIILSGYGDFKYAQQAVRYGVKDYLLKPIDEDELIEQLKNLVLELNSRLGRDSLNKLEATTLGSNKFYGDAKGADFNYCFEKVLGIDSLVDAIEKNNLLSIEALVNDTFNHFHEKLSAVEVIEVYLNNLTVEIMKIIKDVNGDVDEFVVCNCQFISSIEKLHFKEVNQKTLELCSESAAYIKLLKSSNSRGIINEIEKFIKKHYMEDINLKLLSEKFYINPVYLGQQFKKHFGKHFNDYLNEIRVEEAKRLLGRTNKKIYEVAECVGYKNTDYFVGRFQKNINMSPSEYRKSIQANG